MSIFDNVKAEDTRFAKLIKEIADCKSKNPKKARFPQELILKCVSYIQDTKNMTRVKFAERTSVSYTTIQSWVHKYGKEEKNNKFTPTPVSSQVSIFGDMKPDKVVVKDMIPIASSAKEIVPCIPVKEIAVPKEANAIIKTPDGLEIQLPISYLASVLKNMKG